ncbi:MAG TPA: methyltransferase domain-containing protein [Acidimicrobiales bacterium]|nr:methyltransferase domain-containing protein [Acidimicrobiales bacterium]
MSEADAFADVLGCPLCHGPLTPAEDGTLTCSACGARYPVMDGLADLVPPEPGQAETTNVRVMESGLFARVYERGWRPVLTRLLTGMSHDAERAWSLDRLAPAPDATVLDLACGPGNTTRTIADAVPAGRVLGIDFSTAMLREALAAARVAGTTVAYVRGDAHFLPLQPGSVDAANCAGAFYLFCDPPRVLAGIATALRPGGHFTLMASQQPRLGGAATAALMRPSGLRVYARGEMERLLDDAGFDVLDRRPAGFMLLLAARRR